ncbi:KTSC domain-containing protein [Moheibacter stercoris]|uniref:Curved DNA-binding protein CbpA n=1 Tax=Moheibacter stercoris TaxID=1628251 RepID=A0ABV2LV87_9FLAO
MNRVGNYRRLLGVTKDASLKDLKTIYRNLMKETHPDRFIDDEEGKLAAEEKSKGIIEAYHFLTSINKETHEKNSEEYQDTITNSLIKDFYFEKKVLVIIHQNGIQYEYLGVPQNTYVKMVNADSVGRFAKRHIYGKFLHRKAMSTTEV